MQKDVRHEDVDGAEAFHCLDITPCKEVIAEGNLGHICCMRGYFNLLGLSRGLGHRLSSVEMWDEQTYCVWLAQIAADRGKMKPTPLTALCDGGEACSYSVQGDVVGGSGERYRICTIVTKKTIRL